MRDLSKDIVTKIKEGHIVPESRWRLGWKSFVFWVLMTLMVFIGAIAVSLVIINIVDIDPRFFRHMELGRFLFVFMMTAPYLWLGLSVLALVFGVMAFRQTAKGYRRSTLFVTSMVVLVISLLGVFGHFFRVNDRVGEVFLQGGSGLRHLTDPKGGRWQRPGDGLIGGEVLEVQAGRYTLKSFEGEIWTIVYDGKTERIDGVEPVAGEKLGVIGEKTGDFLMRAFSMKAFPSGWNGRPPRDGVSRGSK